MDKFIEDNYRDVITSGSYTVEELRAVAVERGDRELVAWLDNEGGNFPPPVIETAAVGPDETATVNVKAPRVVDAAD